MKHRENVMPCHERRAWALLKLHSPREHLKHLSVEQAQLSSIHLCSWISGWMSQRPRGYPRPYPCSAEVGLEGGHLFLGLLHFGAAASLALNFSLLQEVLFNFSLCCFFGLPQPLVLLFAGL